MAGQIISLFGNSIMRFALPIHLLNMTGSSAILGVVSGCAFIPLAVMSANAVINMVSSLSGLLGPALGGIAYSLWGIYPVLYAAAICFFASALMEIFIRLPFTKRVKSMSILSRI